MTGNDMVDGPDWVVDPEDESGAVMAMVGRQIRLWREAAGLRAAELGEAIGYGENLVYKVEAGTRIAKPEFLDRTDEAVRANGKVAAMKKDAAEARYPKKVRDLAKLEADAVELGSYASGVIDGLLQTEAYARALYGERRPAFTEEQVDRFVAARMARQAIFERRPAPLLPSSSSAASWELPVTGASGARSSQKAARSATTAADAAVVGQSGQRAELAGKLVPRQNLATAGREILRVELGHGPGAGAPVPQPQVPVTVDHSRRDRYGLGLIGGLPGDPARVGNAAQLGGGQPRGQVTGGLFGVLDRRESERVVKYGQGWILAAL
ncbi:Scr1 family TA system antitoxin-like transcriptional regulator [Streptomyces sp. NPDC002932]|uniref:Scr1 family TA system antitoxin-like transcriptional regulator n=1 Tax=Streptomyces sp. NPDC002932 TaxID=3364672 RepID=UPI0036AFB5AB